MIDDSTPQPRDAPDVSTRSLARSTLLNYLSTTLNLLNGVAISIIIARKLGPEQLGVFSGASFVVGLSLTVFGFGIAATAVKILSEYGARFDRATITRVVRMFGFGVVIPAGLAALAVAVALPLSSKDDRYTSLVISLSALSAFPGHLAQSYRGIASGFQEFGYLLRINVGAALILLTGNVVAAVFAPSIPSFIVAGMLPNAFVATAIFLHYRSYLFGRTPVAALPREQLAGIVSFLWPLALITILDTIVWQYSEVLFLGRFRPAQEVAFYSVSFWLATLLLRTVASSVTAGFIPAMSQLYGQGADERIRVLFYTALRFSLLFVTPIAAMIAVVARPVVLFLYGEAYLEAAAYVPALVSAAALAAVAGIAADMMYSTRQQRVILVLAAVVAVLNLGLDVWLIPSHGILGAVIANTSAQAVSATAALALCFTRYRQMLAPRAYLGPLTASAVVVAVTLPLTHYLHGLPAIVAVGVVGSGVYLVFVRVLSLISGPDADALGSIAAHVPLEPVRKFLAGIVRFCAPHAGR